MNTSQRNVFNREYRIAILKKIVILLFADILLAMLLFLIDYIVSFWVLIIGGIPICVYLLAFLQKDVPQGEGPHPIIKRVVITLVKIFLWIIVLFAPGVLVSMINPVIGFLIPIIEAIVIGVVFYKTKWRSAQESSGYNEPSAPYCDRSIVIHNHIHPTRYPYVPYPAQASTSTGEDHRFRDLLILLVLLGVALGFIFLFI